MSSPGRKQLIYIYSLLANFNLIMINSAPTNIFVKWLFFIFRYRRQNEKDDAYGAPVAEVIKENNEATKECTFDPNPCAKKGSFFEHVLPIYARSAF